MCIKKVLLFGSRDFHELRIYILSLRHYLACRGMKPMMNFFSKVGLFFPRPKGGQLFSRGCRPTGSQGKKRSPTKETKSSSKVSVSSTAAKYHVLEGRYIFYSITICPTTWSWMANLLQYTLNTKFMKVSRSCLKILNWIFSLKSF